MKKLVMNFLIAGAILVHLSSCKKLIAAVYGGSDVTVPEFKMTIPKIYSVSPKEIPMGSYSFYFNLDSAVKANTGGIFGANAVNSIKIKKITIKIINPDADDNLANIDSVRVTLQSATNNIPVELFNIGFPDTYANTYDYTTANSPELVNYLKGNTIIYNVYGKMRRVTNKTLSMAVDATLRAD
ncbi:MAG: hypothetical protein ABI472_16935 [Ginsengibacter sp.]